MKKFLAICMMMVMVLSMSFSVYAAPGMFVSSPSGNLAPELIEATPGSDECEAEIIITAYANRGDLSEDIQKEIEDAYKDITSVQDLTKLNADLLNLATKKNIAAANLSISDLFDIRHSGCEDHQSHGKFNIVIKAETLSKFVGLLHKNGDNWELIDNAEIKIIDGEEYLSFSVSEFSPFAIVVDSSIHISDSTPNTGDSSNMYVYATIFAVSFAAVIILFRKPKSQSAK